MVQQLFVSQGFVTQIGHYYGRSAGQLSSSQKSCVDFFRVERLLFLHFR